MLKRFIAKRVDQIREQIYRLGGRPKRGSIWYSPSRDLTYGWKDGEKKYGTLADNLRSHIARMDARHDDGRSTDGGPGPGPSGDAGSGRDFSPDHGGE